MKKSFLPLTRKQVTDVVERKNAAPRVPMIHAKDWGEGLEWIKGISNYTYQLLKRIEQKQKVRQNDYYIRYYSKYFVMIFKAFKFLLKTLSKNGKMYIVIQDATHRGEYIEIDKALRQLFLFNEYKCRIVYKWPRQHFGRRNISKNLPVEFPEYYEKLLEVFKW